MQDDPIVVAGIGLRLPGGVTTLDDLWKTLNDPRAAPAPPIHRSVLSQGSESSENDLGTEIDKKRWAKVGRSGAEIGKKDSMYSESAKRRCDPLRGLASSVHRLCALSSTRRPLPWRRGCLLL
jgi:hypothetical protein